MTYKFIDFLNNNTVPLLILVIAIYILVRALRNRKKYFEVIKNFFNEIKNGEKK